MRVHPLSLLCAALIVSGWPSAAFAKGDSERIVISHGEMKSVEQMLDTLSKADIVVIGEQHDHKQGHRLELEILTGIYARNRSVALSLEMFERDVQLVLDEYLQNEISTASFLAASRPWPNYKSDYAPMIEFCKMNKIPVVAANAPRRYVNIVSTKGQQVLLEFSKKSREHFAKLPYSMDIPPEYDRALTEIFSNHDPVPAGKSGAQSSSSPMPLYIKEGQALWDATMAESILKGRSRTHRKLILQINGAMHSDSRFGIVDRLSKATSNLKILTISIAPTENYPKVDFGKYEKIADFMILTPLEQQSK